MWLKRLATHALLLFPFYECGVDPFLEQHGQNQDGADGAPCQGCRFVGRPSELPDQAVITDLPDELMQQLLFERFQFSLDTAPNWSGKASALFDFI